MDADSDELDGDSRTRSSVGQTGEFGRKGWILVGCIVIAFIVAPIVIVIRPPHVLPFLVAYLVIPLVIAVGLGLVAVWAIIS